MVLLKKKDKKVEEKSPVAQSGVIAEIELAMSGETKLSADDKSEFCFATFQTDKPLSPEDWVGLARAARSGYNFTLVVTKNDEKKE
ncbi:hypothetical protein GOV10_03650 [Candidatus Woesearchaeota archaeon]|nr:hypothetical protein [Candidatus Woesearchaeota archaeon]